MAFDVIKRNNGTWQVRIRLPQLRTLLGKATYHESYDTEREAQRQGQLLHAQFLSGLTPQAVRLEQITLNDVLGKYLADRVPEMRSAASETSRIRKLQKLMGSMRLADISIKFLEEYKANRLGPAETRFRSNKNDGKKTDCLRKLPIRNNIADQRFVQPQTVRHELGTLRRALKHYAYAD